MKKIQLFLAINGVTLLLAASVGVWQQSFTGFINGLFILGLIVLIVGAWLYILDQGFFKIMNYGFKKLRRHLPFATKIQDSDEVFNEALDKETALYSVRQHTHTLPIIWSGCFLVVLSYVSLLFI